MRKSFLLLLICCLAFLQSVEAQQEENYDYFKYNRDMIQRGVQAILMCNGLFTSERPLDLVFEQELAYLRRPIGTARGGDYSIDYDRKAVTIGYQGMVPSMRAVFREGLGCVILPPRSILRRH
jgi:hypothetical protein